MGRERSDAFIVLSNSQLLEKNKAKVKKVTETYLRDTAEPNAINAPAALAKSRAALDNHNFNYTEAIEALEERRDNLCGISRTIIGDTLIRDGRKAIATPDAANATSFAVQNLNICQAAELLLSNSLKKGEITGNVANAAKERIRVVANEALSSLESGINVGAEEVVRRNAAIASALRGVNGANGGKPFDRDSLVKDLDFAKEIVQLGMPSRNVSTISKVADEMGNPKLVVESEVMSLGVTKPQKDQFKSIAAGNGKGIDWYDGLDPLKQELVTKYAGAIAAGDHVIPTQLVGSIPVLRNAYTKVTSILGDDKKLTTIVEDAHSGTPTFHGKGDTFEASKSTIEQAQSFSKSGNLKLVSLNSSIDPGLDSKIVKTSEKVAEEMKEKGVSAVIAPINSRRGFSRDTVQDGYDEELKGVAAAALKAGFLNTAKFLEGDKKFERAALSELSKNPLLRDEVRDDLKMAVEAKSQIDKRSSSKWSLFGTGKVNENLDIVARMNIVSHSMNRGALKVYADQAGVSIPEHLTYCKSGKDRTGLAEAHTSHLAISKHLGLDPLGDAAKKNLAFMINATHTQTMASMQGGSRGCFGILVSSKSSIPSIYPSNLTSITAEFNKLKVDLVSGVGKAIRKVGSFFSRGANTSIVTTVSVQPVQATAARRPALIKKENKIYAIDRSKISTAQVVESLMGSTQVSTKGSLNQGELPAAKRGPAQAPSRF